MKKCMQTDKPLVSILLAVYKPNIKWLIEQLVSLNEQSYENLNLFVYDDCPEEPVSEELFKKYINNFDYKIIRGSVNRGSNKAFEELTKSADGEYFAYCDQDDVWEKNKISILISTILKEKSLCAYSDMSIIDKFGKVIDVSIKNVRPRLKYIYGYNQFEKIFFSNCVAGCCMLIDSKVAKKAIPFSRVTVHDQWLCIIASYYGKISFVNETLVRYRIHNNNQTGILNNINCKKDYYNIRVKKLETRIEECIKCIGKNKMGRIQSFYLARKNRDIKNIFKYRDLCYKEAYFEILIKYMPNFLVNILIKKLKR